MKPLGLWAAFALMLLTAAHGAQDDTSLKARIERLQNTFHPPCCWSETVLRHNSEVAAQMRAEIVTWVGEGKSDREIIDIYKARYGARVLVDPEGAAWWWLHVIAWVMAAAGLLFAVRVIRNLRAAPSPTAANAALAPVNDADLEDY